MIIRKRKRPPTAIDFPNTASKYAQATTITRIPTLQSGTDGTAMIVFRVRTLNQWHGLLQLSRDGAGGWDLEVTDTNKMFWSAHGGATTMTSTASIAANTWYFVAVTDGASATAFRMLIYNLDNNSVVENFTATPSVPSAPSQNIFQLGAWLNSAGTNVDVPDAEIAWAAVYNEDFSQSGTSPGFPLINFAHLGPFAGGKRPSSLWVPAENGRAFIDLMGLNDARMVGLSATENPLRSVNNPNVWSPSDPLRFWLALLSGGTLINIGEGVSGADLLAIDAALAVQDTAAGADTIAVNALLTVLDTALGSDSAAVQALIALSDAAGGADQISVSAAVAVAEAALAAETISIAAMITIADAASGTDQILVDTGSTQINISDVASGVDVAQIAAAVPVLEAAVGADSQAVQALVSLVDAASGADQVSLQQVIAIAETALGADAPAVQALVGIQESGQAAETIALSVLLAVLENAIGADSISVSASGTALDITVTAGLTAATAIDELAAATCVEEFVTQ